MCETVYEEVEIDEEVPSCEDQTETVCFTPPDGVEEVCRDDFVTQVCTLDTVTKTKPVRNTACKTKETARTVCGPQNCPITKSEPVCEDRTKMVHKWAF